MIEYMNHITRDYVRKNRNKTFLFGDNLQQRGMGGQAKEMRGEPNAVGIPTKKKPSMSDDSFFTDDEFHINIQQINNAFNRIPLIGNKIIVIPSAGLGTGLAKLQEKAPKTYEYLQDRLKSIDGMK